MLLIHEKVKVDKKGKKTITAENTYKSYQQQLLIKTGKKYKIKKINWKIKNKIFSLFFIFSLTFSNEIFFVS